MTFQEELKKLNACSAAVEWVGNKTENEAWDTCKRGDWMLWLINARNPQVTLAVRKRLVLCSCDIAETVLKHVPKDEKRPAEAIRLARAWAQGEKVTIDEVKNAANAAYAAANVAANAVAAADAAYVVYAAYAAAYAAYAAANAANAVAYAAWANAVYANADAANAADIVRKYFKTWEG